MKFNNKQKRAFTLIELLIVIAIIGILFIVLVSRVDFATDKAKATGVQTDFRSFQVAFDHVSKENAGFASLGWNTGDDNGDRIRNSYDEGDIGTGVGTPGYHNGKVDSGEIWTGHKVYGETWGSVYTLVNPADNTDTSAFQALEAAINANLDPKLHITITPELSGTALTGNAVVSMANGAQDPWKKEYHGVYITNAIADNGADRGAFVLYSDGANGKWGSEHDIANGIVTVTVPGNNIAGKDDYAIVSCYTYVNGYGEVQNMTNGFSNNQSFNSNSLMGTPSIDNDGSGNNGGSGGGNGSGTDDGGSQGTSTPTLTLNEYGFYYNQPYGGREDSLDDFLVFLTFYENGTFSYTDMSGQGMTGNYFVKKWGDFVNEWIASMGGASEEEVNEINAYFAQMGVTADSTALIGTGNETMPIGVVMSPTNIQTFISDCNVYSCDSNDFTVIGEYGYVISKDGSCYYAMVTDRNKTTYSTPKSEVLGKPVIFYGTYYGCKNLTSITISSGITEIGKNTFDGCTSLTDINIQNGVTKIAESAFEGCTSLWKITIPSNVTEIKSCAFKDCTNLSNINIPERVISIESYAFRSCSRLQSITIPKSVTLIGSWAFADCDQLQSIYCKSIQPPTLENDWVFESSIITTIYVPVESVDIYKAAARWQKFADKIKGYEF